jgi:hypothetical protein
MLFVIHAYEIAWASVFIYLPFAVLILHIVTRRDTYGDSAVIQRHLGDFPYERSLEWNRALDGTDEVAAAARRKEFVR